MTFAVDSREPEPWPWAAYLPEGARLVRGTLETGDLALVALPDGATVDRKTVADFLAAIGRERERVDREVRRARHLGSFCFVVEGTLADVLQANRTRGQLSEAAILGTVAAWTRRGAPVLFAGTLAAAADLAFRIVGGQVKEVQRDARAIARTERAATAPARPSGSTSVPTRSRALAAPPRPAVATRHVCRDATRLRPHADNPARRS